MSKEDNDRRKAKRFKVQEGALAALRPYLACHNPIGTIIDVSERGLSFSYVATGQRANELSRLIHASAWGRSTTTMRCGNCAMEHMERKEAKVITIFTRIGEKRILAEIPAAAFSQEH